MTERRLKHWGWGYEDQAPTATQLREAAEGIRARFGFGGEVEKPVPLEEVELRAPRLKRPMGFGDLFSDGHYERIAHALGKCIPGCGAGVLREVRESAGSRDFPEGRVGDRGGAELGRGRGCGGDPLWRRHQRLRWGRAAAGGAAGGLAGPAAAGPGAGSRSDFAGGADSGRRDRPRPRGPAARARAHPAPLPPVLRVLDPRRLGRDPGRRPLRDAGDPHRRPGRVGAGDHPAGDLGEPAAAGLRRRPLAGPAADRLGGDPRRDRRGLGAGAAAARAQGVDRRRVRRLRRRRRRGPRHRPVRSASRQLPAARRQRGRADRCRRRQRQPADPRLRVRRPPGRPLDGPGAGDRPRPRRHPRRGPHLRRRRRRGGAAGAGRSCWRRTCATPSSPAASSPRPSRRRSPGTASRSSTRR